MNSAAAFIGNQRSNQLSYRMTQLQFMLIIGFDPVINAVAGWGVPASIVNAVSSCSLMQHFDSMRRGVIDFYDIGYYIGVMIFMLAAAHVVTDNRKAS